MPAFSKMACNDIKISFIASGIFAFLARGGDRHAIAKGTACAYMSLIRDLACLVAAREGPLPQHAESGFVIRSNGSDGQ
jgi:hypothetical protein